MVRLRMYTLGTGHVETLETFPDDEEPWAELMLQTMSKADHGSSHVYFLSSIEEQ